MYDYNQDPKDQNQMQDQSRIFSQLNKMYEQDKEHTFSSIFEIDNEPIIDKIVQYLRGKHFIDKRWQPIDPEHPDGNRIMNEKGIMNFVTILRPHLDKMMILSELTMDEIYMICRRVSFMLIRLLSSHYQEFHIVPTKANLSLIHGVIDNIVFTTVRRAHRGGERRHRETMLKLVEQYVQKETEKTGGISLNPFKALMKKKE